MYADDANREQTSRKRAGSPLLTSSHPLDSEARPVKRLLSTDPRKPASSVNEPIGSSVELDPTGPSLPPLHSSFRTSFSSPPASQHSVEAGKGKKARDDAAAPPSGQEEKPPVTLEQQACIYPTPQTGDFHDRETFELPPLQPRTPHTNGNGQGRSFTTVIA